jgi:hypothetical protein
MELGAPGPRGCCGSDGAALDLDLTCLHATFVIFSRALTLPLLDEARRARKGCLLRCPSTSGPRWQGSVWPNCPMR